MMGFARQHKSTGNMLAGSGEKFAFCKQTADDDGKDKHGKSHDKLDSDRDYAFKSSEDSPARHLLLAQPLDQRNKNQQSEANKWSSCAKLLGNEPDRYRDRTGGAKYRPLAGGGDELLLFNRGSEAAAIDRRHSKSIGEFPGSRPQPPVASSKCCGQDAVEQRPRLLSVMVAKAKSERQATTTGDEQISGSGNLAPALVFGADQQQEDPYVRLVKFSSLSLAQSSGSGQDTATSKTSARLRKRKVAARLRSASLSSAVSCGPASKVSLSDVSQQDHRRRHLVVAGRTTEQHMLDNDAQQVSTGAKRMGEQGHRLVAEDNGAGQEQASNVVGCSALSGETKASCSGRQLHCFVDVGHLQQQLTTAGRSSYYSSSNDNSNAKTAATQQDNKLVVDANAHDNGIDSAGNTFEVVLAAGGSSSNSTVSKLWRGVGGPTPSLAAAADRNMSLQLQPQQSDKQPAAFHCEQPQQQQQQQQVAADQQPNLGATNKQVDDRLVSGQLASSEGEGSVGGGQWRPAGSSKANGSAATMTTTNSNRNNSLAIELNHAANKLMGSCGQTWRQALHSSKSGSYKVARKQHVVTISGDESKETAPANNENFDNLSCAAAAAVRQRHQEQESFVPGNSEGANVARSLRRSARHSRPSRSPISLQRQTNARLTRHRLKIQQQRQEQLSQLALREREQLKNTNIQRRLDSTVTNYSRDFMQTRDFSTNCSYVSGVAGIGNRQAKISVNATPDINLDQQTQQTRTKQQQVIFSTSAPSTAIEICDNQLACSSRQFSTSTTADNHRSYTTNNQASNVIAYKSSNMPGNDSAISNHRQIECDEHESITSADDARTIYSSSSSSSSLSLNKPFCKVCHIGNGKNGDKLISPCRCSGTMQYIHCGCLLKWLEISNRSNEKPMSCELCAHEYSWHKKFNYDQIRLPKCSLKDIFLHLIFVAALGVMLFSALSPILQKGSSSQQSSSVASRAGEQLTTNTGYKTPSDSDPTISRHRKPLPSASYHHPFNSHSNHLVSGQLGQDEKYILMCAASFFISFFLAIYVQTKARDTLCGLIVKFLNMNQTYYITEYDHGQLSGNGGKQHHHQQNQQNNSEISRAERKILAQQKS